MSILFRSLLTKELISFDIFLRKRETELLIHFDCDADHSRWQPFFNAKFDRRGITKFVSKNVLSAMFPSEELEPFLGELLLSEEFVRQTELDGLEFYTNHMGTLHLISKLFDSKVPSISFNWIRSNDMKYSQHWLAVVEKLKPQKIFINLVDLCKASLDFLLKLASVTTEVTLSNITVKPDSDILQAALKSLNGNVVENRDENKKIIDNATKCVIRMLAREMLSRKCTTLFLGLPYDDTEMLIEIFHHLNKKISFGTCAVPFLNTHIDEHTQIGDYKVNILPTAFARMRVITHTHLDNPFVS